MFNVRQFRKILYILLILGMSGFALAAQAPALWVFAVGLILLNAWLVKTERFRPLPRAIAGGITVLAMLFMLVKVRQQGPQVLLNISLFLVLLQLVKLYETRANRDYMQLITLSLLLMVAAAITTASVVFGVLFLVYLFLCLHCSLMLHLKYESDQAKAAFAISEAKLDKGALLLDEPQMARSMRQLTGLVAFVSIMMGVTVFVFFPRGSGAGILGGLRFKPAQALTGFDDQVSFEQVARITQNEDVVARVTLRRDRQSVKGTMGLFLRGVTLDTYTGKDPGGGPSWQWVRTSDKGLAPPKLLQGGEHASWEAGQISVEYRINVRLEPTHTRAIFTLPGLYDFVPRKPMSVQFGLRDRTLSSREPIHDVIEYEAYCTNDTSLGLSLRDYELEASRVDPRIREYAISVLGDAARDRIARDDWTPQAGDEQLARSLEKHLRENFTYTLDLTGAGHNRNEDPMVQFLENFKSGHCEYFAGAMTLLCQSLKMQARMVVGFYTDEYNTIGDFYVVKQSHAHAWVEARTPNGWVQFDPTSGRESTSVRADSMVDRVRQFFDFLDYSWANYVIAYDITNRQTLMDRAELEAVQLAMTSQRTMGNMRDWFSLPGNFQWLSSRLMQVLIGVLVLGCVALGVWFFGHRFRLRRAAQRIGLEELPASDQLRLAKQLGFYSDLLAILEQHNIVRAKHQTPREFSHSLSYLPAEAYHAIRRLTGLFYRIRYGGEELRTDHQKRIGKVVDSVGESLAVL